MFLLINSQLINLLMLRNFEKSFRDININSVVNVNLSIINNLLRRKKATQYI